MKKNKAAILEPNDFHGEVVAGVIGYFRELGYTIDIYVRENNYKELSTLILGEGIEIVKFKIDDVREILVDSNMSQYEVLFVTSLEYKDGRELVRFLDFLGFVPRVSGIVMGMYHSVFLVRAFHDLDMSNEGRIFWLSEFQADQAHGKMLSPHAFPIYNITSDDCTRYGTDDRKIRIAALGSMGNQRIISEALGRLSKKERERLSIIHIGGEKPTKIRIFWNFTKQIFLYGIGGVFSARQRGKRYIHCIDEKGRLNFKEMFDEISGADFLLIPFSYHSIEGVRYMTSNTSGTKSISLGFHRPLICNDILGDLYGYTPSSGVFFHGDKLEEGLRKVLSLDDEMYQNMKAEVECISNSNYKLSLENLRRSIKACQTR